MRAMFEDIYILNLLDLHVSATLQLYIVHLNGHIMTQRIRLIVRSEWEERCQFLDGRELVNFLWHFFHVYVREITVEYQHLKQRYDGEEHEEGGECSLQLHVCVDTEAKAVERIVNAVTILIDVRLRPAEDMRSLCVDLILECKFMLDLSSVG